MSIADKLTTIAENEQKVYEAGKQAEYDRLVDPTKIIEKTVSGTYISVTDVSEIPHKCTVSVDKDATITVYKKNLVYSDTLVEYGTKGAGSVEIPFLPAGTYTASALVTKYEDDLATSTRIEVRPYYTDGTKDTFIGIEDKDRSECDGIPRVKTCTFLVDATKELSYVMVQTLSYSSTGGATRNAKAENIQVEPGSAYTGYEPFESTAYTIGANKSIEIDSACPAMSLFADADATLTFGYHKSYGTQSESERIWSIFQQNGKRDNYQMAHYGKGWTVETYNPIYDMKPITIYYMFGNSGIRASLVDILKRANITFDTSNCTNCGYAFYTSEFTEIPLIDMTKCSGTSANYVFADNPYLKKVSIKIAADTFTAYTGWFRNCLALEDLTVDGVIDKGGMDLHYSTLLTYESLMSVINALKNWFADNVVTDQIFDTSIIVEEFDIWEPADTYAATGEKVYLVIGTDAAGCWVSEYCVIRDGVYYVVDVPVWGPSDDETLAGYVLTLGASNLAKLTDAEKAIATEKGWTLA